MENVSVGGVTKEMDIPAGEVYRFLKDLSKSKYFQFYICLLYIFHPNRYYCHSIHWGKSRFEGPLQTKQTNAHIKSSSKGVRKGSL